MGKKEEIEEFIGKCCKYLEHRYPGDQTIDEWSLELSGIPVKYFPEIYSKFKQLEGWPKNFPNKIKELFRSIDQSEYKDFLIDIIERNARDHNIDFLESFYDLRHPIKIKGINMGPAIKWLHSQGFRVDMSRINDTVIPRESIAVRLETKWDKDYHDQF
jgi:hypothetical protein